MVTFDYAFDFYLNGISYGLISVFSWTSIMVNLFSVWNYRMTRMNFILIVADVSAILRSTLQTSLWISQNGTVPYVIITKDFFIALAVGILAFYPTLRYLKMLRKYQKMLALVLPPTLLLATFLRSIGGEGLIDLAIPNIILVVVYVPTFVIVMYCFFQVGYMIRNNPGSKFDERQVRLEKLSIFLVFLAGSMQIVGIAFAFSVLANFVKSMCAWTNFILSCSDLLMVINQHTESQSVILLVEYPASVVQRT